MPTKPSLGDLDLSKLSKVEQEAMTVYLTRNNPAWPMAVICSVLSGMALFLIIRAGAFGTPGSWNVVLKILGYLALGYWARGWSRLAVLLLFAWHIYTCVHYVSAPRLQLKLHFWIPAAVFTWGCLQAFARASLIKRAQPATPPASTI